MRARRGPSGGAGPPRCLAGENRLPRAGKNDYEKRQQRHQLDGRLAGLAPGSPTYESRRGALSASHEGKDAARDLSAGAAGGGLESAVRRHGGKPRVDGVAGLRAGVAVVSRKRHEIGKPVRAPAVTLT
jgi:hypothetical protein